EIIDDDNLKILVATSEWFDTHSNLPKYIDIYIADKVQMAKISSLSNAPEVLAVLSMKDVIKPVSQISIDSNQLYLLLDGIQDPGNMGTIIRTADWFGIRTIIASLDTVDIYNPKVIQSSMGSLQRVEIIYCDLLTLLINLKEKIPVYATVLNGKNIYQSNLTRNGIIIFGNEGQGISKKLMQYITDGLKIPPFNNDYCPDSLNVSVAAGIVMSIFRNTSIIS
ncbi:MAG: RNA methyltransferase, partial [Muribaculaceae bacterium]|nr:RNA methyltransferase [Muribaculaceae bacterium]